MKLFRVKVKMVKRPRIVIAENKEEIEKLYPSILEWAEETSKGEIFLKVCKTVEWYYWMGPVAVLGLAIALHVFLGI